MTLQKKIDAAMEIYRGAVNAYWPAKVIALYSGGHDSVVATDIIHRYWPAVCERKPDWTVHINTGIQVVEEPEHEIPNPAQWVRWMAEEQRWNLRIYRALDNLDGKGNPDPQDYDRLCIQHDFPGPAGHGMMYARLKERPLRQVIRDARSDIGIDRTTRYWRDVSERYEFRVLLVSGCRAVESVRRMGTTKKIHREGVRVWVNPLIDFTNEDVREYIEYHRLPTSPIANLIHKSGECLCGAFAQPGELKEYEMLLPATAARIHELQEKVRAAGHKGNWGCRPYKGSKKLKAPGPLCQGCIFVG